MDLDIIFEKLRYGNDSRFKENVIEIIKKEITQFDDVEDDLLTFFQSGKYYKMLDCLLGVMMKQLRSRINHLGLEAFNQGNGLGYILGTDNDLENLPINKELIDIAANMDALFPSQEMELRSAQNQIELLKRNLKGNLTYQQRKEIFEILKSAISFFDSPMLENWDIGERFYFLILNSEIEDLQPIINPKLARLNEEELEQVAGNLFMGRMNEDNTLGQCESIEFCFQIVWDLLSERIIKRLIRKVEDILVSCTEDELVIGTELLRSVGGLGDLSENSLGKMLESYFTDQEVEDLLETPDIMKTMILDLKFFGVQYLPEAHYEAAAQVFLDFYINFPGIPLRDNVENVDEAVHFIPEILKRCKLEFLEYFNFQIRKFEVLESNKYRIEKLNDLKGIINRRKDFVGAEREE